MISSKPENMLATIEMIKKDFGSADEYMRKNCGLTEDEIKRIRKNITNGALSNM